MRFGLHLVPDQNPVLAFCNAAGNIFFWDFTRLSIYSDVMQRYEDPDRDKTAPFPLPSWLKPVIPRQRAGAAGRFKQSASEKLSASMAQNGGDFSSDTLESWGSRYDLKNAHEPLRAHKSESSSANFVGRKAAWSPGGEWCVVVGSNNTALILQRWAKKPSNGTE